MSEDNKEEREWVDENHDNIDDRIQPPTHDIEAGSKKLADRLQRNNSTDPTLSGGDIDARWEDADSTGSEAVAGSMPTPGRQIDEMGKSMGVEYQDNEPLKVGSKERQRDKERWELDPASSEGYEERAKEQSQKNDGSES